MNPSAGAVPATPLQEALWWVHHRARDSSVYHLTWRLSCAAPVDFAALTSAWQVVTDRHEVLRTALVDESNNIQLAVSPVVTARVRELVFDDAGDVPLRRLFSMVAEEVHQEPMTLQDAPLARITLITAGVRQELLVTVHHAVIDGWGMQLLINDLSRAYQAAVHGQVASFDKQPVPFSDYAQRLHQDRTSGAWTASLDYWQNMLHDAATTTVVADRHDFTDTGDAGEILRYSFSPEAVQGMAALMARTFATPFATLLSALQTVLARGGAGPDIAVGVVTANRMSQREQGIVGYLANVMVIRGRIAEDDTLARVTERARDAMWSSLPHQSVPFPVVFTALDEMAQRRLRDVLPLLLTFHGPIGGDLRLGEVPMHLLESPNRAARADIGIGVFDVDGELMAEVEYNSGRYDQRTVLRLLQDLDAVLGAGAGEDCLVGTLTVQTRSVLAAADHTPPATTPTLGAEANPESPGLAVVRRVWTRSLGVEPASPEENFFAAGGWSVKVLELAAALQAETGVAVDVVRWLADPTPRGLAEQLDPVTFRDTARDRTVVTVREGSGPHLHLLYGAGGAHDYRELTDALPAHWRITVSPEGQPSDSIEALAAGYVDDLQRAALRPDILAGWSMGGLTAYAMAAQMVSPPALAMLDAAPPVGYADAGSVESAFTDFAATVCGALNLAPPVPRTESAQLAVVALAGALRAAGQQLSAAALDERWTVYLRHRRAVAGYVSTHRIDSPALVIAADLLDEQIDQWAQRLPQLRRLRVTADHFTMLRPPIVAEIAAAIEGLEQSRHKPAPAATVHS